MDKKVAIADLKQSFNAKLYEQVLVAHQLVNTRKELLLEAERDWEAKATDFAGKQVDVQVLIDQLAYLITEVTRLRNVAGRAQSALGVAYQLWNEARAEMMSAERDVAHRTVTLDLAQMRCETDTDRTSWHSQRRLDAIASLDEAHARATNIGQRVIETDDKYREALYLATQSNVDLHVTSLAYYSVNDTLREQVHVDCMDDDLKHMLSEFMLACMAEGVDASV